MILAYAAEAGTLEGCTCLDPEDRAEADALLEAAWPPVAGTSHAWDEDIWRGEPARWTVTFSVDDTDGTVERAVALGATVRVAPHSIEPVRAAGLPDPQGVDFDLTTYQPDA